MVIDKVENVPHRQNRSFKLQILQQPRKQDQQLKRPPFKTAIKLRRISGRGISHANATMDMPFYQILALKIKQWSILLKFANYTDY